MIIEQVSIHMPPGKRQEVGSALAALINPTETQLGCLRCRLLQNWHDPDELVVEANWEAAEDLNGHLRSDLYKRLLLLMELCPVAPVLQFCTVQEVRGLDLVQEARRQSASTVKS